jgi:hypothetical protein
MTFDTTQIAQITQRAKDILRANDVNGIFTKPGPRQYPHQWNWDSATVALGLATYDLPRAFAEARSLIAGQWVDGMIPHVIYHTGVSDYFPDPEFWQIHTSPFAPKVQTSGITQPPLLATMARRIYEFIAQTSPARESTMLEFLREIHPALVRWHRWLHTARDADGSGLCCLIHPWESGTDDSPRWLKAFERIHPVDVPLYKRRDTVHVHASFRPTKHEYDRYVHLIDVFRRNRYEPAALLARSPFLAQDILFNSILHRADEDLAWMARVLGESDAEIQGWMQRTHANFDAHHWDDVCGLYFDRDVRAGCRLEVNTAMTFAPLYAGLASAKQAERLIAHLADVNEYDFSPDRSSRLRYGITSTAFSEAVWDAQRYWRGPSWIILNWILAQGFRRYGYETLYQRAKQDSLDLIVRTGFYENYDPRDGAGCGSADFSWPAALWMIFNEVDQVAQVSSRVK